MDTKKPFVIAVSSVSGGGKTTVVNKLSQELISSKVLFFDDYDFIQPDNICEWVDSGANYNEWELTPMVQDLSRLLSEESDSLKFILLDYPFARVQSQMREYIDLTIFIDTPLDIAMARRILRDYPNDRLQEVFNDMELYLSRSRNAYMEMLNTIKPNCDVVIDGKLSLIEIVKEILKEIRNKRMVN